MAGNCTYSFKGLDDQSIINSVVAGSGLPACSIDKYTEEQLRQLAPLLINAIRGFIAKEAGISEVDIQEWIDCMHFKAKKDSRTSSMRPSSDMYRSTAGKGYDDSPDGGTDSPSPSANSKEQKPGSKQKGKTPGPADSKGQGPEATGPNGQEPDATDPKSPDCDTSSGPPEDDREKQAEEELRKDHDRSLRTWTGRKPGGQQGHPGAGFQVPPNVDEVRNVIIPPEKCKGCPKWESCAANAELGTRHNVYDFEIHIKQTVYQEVRSVPCPEDGHEEKSDYPEEAKGVNQYGINVQTMVCLLYCVGMVSLDRIKKIIGPLLGLQISTATVQRYVSLLASKVKDTVDAILEAEKSEKVVHCDETGAKVGGTLCWIHCIATSLYTFVSLQAKRGKEGMDAIGFLSEYVGTVVHDCWSAYWGFVNCAHAVCNGHIQRELVGISKFFHNAKLWADDMVALLQEMLHAKHLAQEKGQTELPRDTIAAFSERFDALIARGKEVHPLPERKPGQKGRLKRGRARALVDRMESRKAEIFKFLMDFDVPYTNNIAESSFRLLGTKRSVGCFRSIEAAQEFCIIWSYLSTCAKHGISYYDAVKEAFAGRSMQLLFPERMRQDKTDNPNTDEAA